MSTTQTGEPSQLTTQIPTAEPASITYGYRRFGNEETRARPPVFLQHLRGIPDSLVPILVDDLAEQREVVLLDNTGVASPPARCRLG